MRHKEAVSAKRKPGWLDRGFWFKQMRLWHWVSAAVTLSGLILFTVTGITLNHAGDIRVEPKVVERTARLPEDLLSTLETLGTSPEAQGQSLPQPVRQWLARELNARISAGPAEWSDMDVYLPMARPGSDAWLSIDFADGAVLYEKTDRGMIAYLNDLHKGRDTGAVWRWFIDIFAVASLIFAITGVVLLQLYAKTRPSTWPLVGLGVVIPLILAIVFIH
ncbi:PepSY-associated TM helix domain-containing protein [Woodsholea maritima]|uniref:PepSY-associated TM helix domain-containing protein n=1 Tax=Woodsholea maritima TaxID=240237 RepID=UPI00035F91CD|nr:PepSY-associated TM helix domain-containing protein [Woodsholea maritima]